MTEDYQRLWNVYLAAVRNDRVEKIGVKERIRSGKRNHRYGPETEERIEEAVSHDAVIQSIDAGNAEQDKRLRDEFTMIRPALELVIVSGEIKTLKQLHQIAEHLIIYEAAQKELEAVNVQEVFADHLDEYIEKDMIAVETYLRHEELLVYSLHGNMTQPRSGSILTPNNSEAFFSQFEEEHLQSFLESMFFHRKLERHLIFQFARHFKHVAQALEVTLPGKKKLYNELLPTAVSLCAPYMERFTSLMPLERVLELVSSRKRYRKSAKQFEQFRAIRNAMLRAIPAHYRDLYPLARKMHRSFILHIGPTNSGKTYDAVTRLEESGNGVYLAPLRLLAYEQFDTINRDGVPCSLLTGEEEISVVCSKITASTIEMMDLQKHYAVAVIDEAQMIADPERGGSWSSAILGLLADEIHVCASPDAEQLLTRIIQECGDSVRVVHHERQTPLYVQEKPFRFPDDVQDGDALVVFSKRSVHAVAAELMKAKYARRPSIIYGALPYDVRHEQARRFREGETKVVVATDAIGMGLNMPIRRIVFLEMSKFDGHESRDLKDSEIKQIAGRAGRFGIYDEGIVAATGGISILKEAIHGKDKQLDEAVIQFHETLLGIDAPLSVILSRWNDLEPQQGWNKADIQRLLILATMMERGNTDKGLLYRMITIPFDEKDSILLELWRDMFLSEEKGKHMDVIQRLPEVTDIELVSEHDLDRLEHEYRVCDLLSNYARLFLKSKEETRKVIDERKSLLSKGIMKILAARRLKGKICRRCGRSMPWNYPFSVCEKCYRNEKRTYGGNW